MNSYSRISDGYHEVAASMFIIPYLWASLIVFAAGIGIFFWLPLEASLDATLGVYLDVACLRPS